MPTTKFCHALNLLCILALCLSACAPGQPPSPSPFTPTPAVPTPAPTALPPATVAPTAPPPATSTPLALAVGERPTPVPAPTCLTAAWPPSASRDVVTGIAAAESSRVFVSVYSPVLSRTQVYISDDDGATWSSAGAFNDFISRIVPSPSFDKDRTVYLAGSAGVYRSLSGGSNWAVITLPTWVTTTALVRQLAVSPNFANDHTILLGSRAAPRGVFASTDGGATWIDWLVDAVDALFFSPNYALDHAVWAARNDEQNFRRDVLVTVNDGESWGPVRAGTAQPLALSPSFAQDSTIIWTDPASGLYISRNGDKLFPSLQKVSADVLTMYRFDPQGGWSPAGEQPVTALTFSPNFALDRTAYALTDSTLAVSRDGGATWSPLCYWAFDAARIQALRLTQLAVTHGSVPVMLAGGAGSRLALSRDGGASWTPVTLK